MANLVNVNNFNLSTELVDYMNFYDFDNYYIEVKKSVGTVEPYFVVEDPILEENHKIVEETIDKFNNTSDFYSEEEIFQILLVVYRKYDAYNTTLELSKDKATTEERRMGEKDQEAIYDVLSFLMERYSCDTLHTILSELSDAEMVKLFYKKNVEELVKYLEEEGISEDFKYYQYNLGKRI